MLEYFENPTRKINYNNFAIQKGLGLIKGIFQSGLNYLKLKTMLQVKFKPNQKKVSIQKIC